MGDKIKKQIVVFLSSPFTGLTDEELRDNHRNNVRELTDIVCKHYGVSDIKILCAFENQDNFKHSDICKHKGLYYVGKYMSDFMSTCDVVVFGHNWRTSTGCVLEQYATSLYGLDYIDLDQRNVYVHTNQKKGVYLA